MNPTDSSQGFADTFLKELGIDRQTLDQIRAIDPTLMARFYGDASLTPEAGRLSGPLDDILEVPRARFMQNKIRRPTSRLHEGDDAKILPPNTGKELLRGEARASILKNSTCAMFPPTIWTCCKRLCFSKMAMQPDEEDVLLEVRTIHEKADLLFDRMRSGNLIEARRVSVGGSSVVHAATRRSSLNAEDRIHDPSGTDRVTAQRDFKKFCVANLGFLRGNAALIPGSRRFQEGSFYML